MAATDADKTEVAALLSQLKNWAEYYYTFDAPLVSDAVYDASYRRLEALETQFPELRTPDSPTARIGGPILKGFTPVRHKVRMLSLYTETDTTDQGAIAFDTRVRKELGLIPSDADLIYMAEPKYDGLAVNLRYENRLLVSAATRGDGETGEEVVTNIRTIKDIPKVLPAWAPDVLEVRGEVYLSHEQFAKYNAEQIAAGQKPLVNCRNGAAGGVRQLDSNAAKRRGLSFFAYSLGEVSVWAGSPHTQQQLLQAFRDLGFQVSELARGVDGVRGLIAYHQHIESVRGSLPYDIDGVVYKVMEFHLQEQLGTVSRQPRWACAHKFVAEEAVAVLTGIDVQIGRTGNVTPVARITPTFVGGVTVTNATLHNVFEIRRKRVRLNDQVVVRRAGDVVPEIAGTLAVSPRVPYVPNFRMPKYCPICNWTIWRPKGEVRYRCDGGLFCAAQRKEMILHFANRRAMDIDGLGDKIVGELVDKHLVETFPDLYRLKLPDLMQLDRLGELNATKLLEAIKKSKKTTLARFLFALGIRQVGESTAKDLAKHFGDLDPIRDATVEQLQQVPDVGPIVAQSIHAYFRHRKNGWMVDELDMQGVGWPIADPQVQVEHALAGKSFVLTGTFPSLSRDEVSAKLEAIGAKVVGSVSKKTDYVVAGENAGSKLDKAKSLNIPILDEAALLSLISS